MALSSALLKRLDDEEEPLPKRLRLALCAFESDYLPVQRKEELILNWLSINGENGFSDDVWKVFEACINSSHIKKLNATVIRPAVLTSVSQIFIRLLADKTFGSRSTILNCAVGVIENPNFQQHFKRQLKDYFELLISIIDCSMDNNKSDYCITVLQNISSLNKQVLNKEEFSVFFMSKLINIALVPTYFENNEDASKNQIKSELFKCIQRVLFSKTRFKEISLGLKSLFDEKNVNQCVLLALICEFLSSAISDYEERSHHVFHIIFQAFVGRYKSDPVSVHRMLIVICHFLGFKPKIKLLPDNEPTSFLDHKKFKKMFPESNIRRPVAVSEISMKIVKMLIEVLSEENVELNVNSQDLPLHQWLQSLISEIFSVWSITSEEQVKVRLLEVMCAFIKLNPIIIEPKMDVILDCVLLSKKESSDLKLAYAVFLHNVLEMFVKLSRLRKLVTKVLSMRIAIERRNTEELATLPDILTSEFCAEFRTAVSSLLGKDTITFIRSFVFSFGGECVAPLENLEDDSPVLLIEIISELLCHFLRGTRMAEYTLNLQIVSSYTEEMISLQSLLGRLGQAILQREHNCSLIRSFLQVCYNWGETKLLLVHYGVETEMTSSFDFHLPALQEDLSATNLSYVHPYLNSELWNLVAQRVGNFAELDIKEILEKMVLQKLRAVVMFVKEGKLKQDVTAAIARHGASHIKESMSLLLTETNSLLVTPYLNPDHLEVIANHILHEKVLDAQAPDFVLESKELVVAITCSTLNGILKLFSKMKRKHDSPNCKAIPPTLVRDVLSKLDTKSTLKCLLENEMDELSPTIVAMSSMVQAHLQKEKTSIIKEGPKLDITLLHRYLELLKSLPLQYTSNNIKSVVAVSMLALAITLEDISALENEEMSFSIQELLYKDLLLGLLDSPSDPDFCSNIDVGLVVRWLTRVNVCLPKDLYCLLFQRLFEISLLNPTSLTQLEASLQMLQNLSDFEAKDMEVTFIFLHIFKKFRYKYRNAEHRILLEKYHNQLTKGVVKALENSEESVVSPAVAEGFCLVLTHYATKKNQKPLKKLGKHLCKMVETAVSVLQEKDLPSGYKSYAEILAVVVDYRLQLKEFLPKDFMMKIWSVLSSQNSILILNSYDHMKQIFTTASKEELQIILENLLKITKKSLKSSEGFEANMSIWKLVASTKFECSTWKNDALRHLCNQLTTFLSGSDSTEKFLLPILDLLTIIAQSPLDVFFSYEMLDLCFKSVTTAFKWECSDVFNLCMVLLNLLETLVKKRNAQVLDCIPSLLQCYRRISQVLASHGHVELKYSPAQVQQCATCVHRLERLTNSLKHHQDHFEKVAAFMIADFLQIFETYTFYPQVKMHFSNCIYALLSICDGPTISFLSRNLSPASQQLLKSFRESYIKFYRFTGKI